MVDDTRPGRHREAARYNPAAELSTIVKSAGQTSVKASAVLAASGGLVATFALPAQAATPQATASGTTTTSAPPPPPRRQAAGAGSSGRRPGDRRADQGRDGGRRRRQGRAPSRSRSRSRDPSAVQEARRRPHLLVEREPVVGAPRVVRPRATVLERGRQHRPRRCSASPTSTAARARPASTARASPSTSSARPASPSRAPPRPSRRAATPVSDPKPGDLVFFGSPAWHVGIYTGNGMMIDSPRSGEVHLRAADLLRRQRVRPLLSRPARPRATPRDPRGRGAFRSAVVSGCRAAPARPSNAACRRSEKSTKRTRSSRGRRALGAHACARRRRPPRRRPSRRRRRRRPGTRPTARPQPRGRRPGCG